VPTRCDKPAGKTKYISEEEMAGGKKERQGRPVERNGDKGTEIKKQSVSEKDWAGGAMQLLTAGHCHRK